MIGHRHAGGLAWLVAALRSTLFAAVFYTGSVPLVVAAAISGRPATVMRLARVWSGWFAWTTRVIVGVRYRVEGAVPAPPVLAAFKHQSMYETLLLPHLLGNPAAVMKAELLAIPLWERAARTYGIVPIERAEAGAALRVMLRAAATMKAAGRTLVVFPEGTRTRPGEAPPLRPGLAGLYRALALPLVPVAVDSGRCWPKGFVKYPGLVTFRFGAAIPPGLDRAEVDPRVHAAINALNGA